MWRDGLRSKESLLNLIFPGPLIFTYDFLILLTWIQLDNRRQRCSLAFILPMHFITACCGPLALFIFPFLIYSNIYIRPEACALFFCIFSSLHRHPFSAIKQPVQIVVLHHLCYLMIHCIFFYVRLNFQYFHSLGLNNLFDFLLAVDVFIFYTPFKHSRYSSILQTYIFFWRRVFIMFPWIFMILILLSQKNIKVHTSFDYSSILSVEQNCS